MTMEILVKNCPRNFDMPTWLRYKMIKVDNNVSFRPRKGIEAYLDEKTRICKRTYCFISHSTIHLTNITH